MAALFNESLRKVNEQQPPTIIEEDETPKRGKRPPDLEHFKIISEKWRSSCSDDSDDSLPNNLNTTRFCKSVDFRPFRRDPVLTGDSCSTLPNSPVLKKIPPLTTMASGGSRFKVVPVETRYKRDRWTCVDYYDNLRDPYFSPGKHAVPKPAAAIKKEEVVNRTNRSLSDIHPSSSPSVVQPSAIPVQQKSTSNIIAPNPKPVYTVPKVAPTAQVKASTTIQPTANGQVKVSSETQVSSGADETRRTKSVAASPPAHHGNNIDNKIEQAMDLVKTHLMFAVREEVDGLRSKIYDLENHVRRLEAENSILKRTIPNDTLKQLHLKL